MLTRGETESEVVRNSVLSLQLFCKPKIYSKISLLKINNSGGEKAHLLRKPLMLGGNMITSEGSSSSLRGLCLWSMSPPTIPLHLQAPAPVLFLSFSTSFLPSNGRRVTNLISCNLKEKMLLNSKSLEGFLFLLKKFGGWGSVSPAGA